VGQLKRKIKERKRRRSSWKKGERIEKGGRRRRFGEREKPICF
jgi:hypothetical protein